MSKNIPTNEAFPANSSANVSANSLANDPLMHGSEVSLREIIEIVLKGKWIIFITFAVVLAVAAVYTFWVPSEYDTTGLIKVGNSKENAGSAALDPFMGLGTANRNISNELELLKSRSLAKRVSVKLLDMRSQGKTMPLLKPNETGRISEQVVAERIKKMLKVKQVNQDVDLIELQFTSTDPGEAQFVANTYMDEYKDWRLQASRQSISSTRDFYEKQFTGLKEELDQSEQNLRNFMNERGVVQLDQEAQQVLQQVQSIENERDKAKVEYARANSELRSLKDQIDQKQPGIRDRVSSTAEQEIGVLKGRISELQVALETKRERVMTQDPTYRGREDQHPEVKPLLNELNLLKNRLNERSNTFLEESESIFVGSDNDATGVKANLGYINQLRSQMLNKEIEVSGLNARQGVLNSRLGEYESKLRGMPNISIDLVQLQRDREGKSKMYEYLSGKYQEAKAAETAKVGDIYIVDQAEYPTQVARPNRPLNLLIGGLLGLALGIGLVFLRNALDDVIRKPEDVRKRGYSVLGIIPTMERIIKTDFKGKDKIIFEGRTINTSLLSLINPLSPVSEAFRRLRTNVEYSKLDTGIQTLLITSPAPGDGKSVTAMNLAIAMAQSGRRTLYIDADLRRPTGHKMIEMPKEPGLVELLFEVQPFHSEDFSAGIEDLYIIPAGSTVPNPAELLASRKMRDFVQKLRQEFDMIILDSPPVLAVSDAVLLVNQADAALVVISAGETNWQGLERSVEALSGIGSRVAGVVVNRFDPKAAYGYYSYYNNYDGYYYSYSTDHQKEAKKG
jgi:tyrosine-protein kinase Etk/Wzc